MSDDDLAQIDEIGVIARVAPEDKVRLVERSSETARRRHDRRRRQRRAGAQEGRHRRGDGHHGHRGLQGGRGDDPHRRQLRDDRARGRARPRALRQPAKYIRFQMGVLVGFIVTFLGASIFNVVGGVPFVPLQTLYVNFTTQVFQSIGLGYGRPADGLMKRKPRPSDEQILPRPLLIWVGIAGLVMGGSTLALIAWADDYYNHAQTARTMGLTMFALSNVFFSFTARDEHKSVFSLDVLGDRMFLYSPAARSSRSCWARSSASCSGSCTPSTSTSTSGSSASASRSRSCRWLRDGGCCSSGGPISRPPLPPIGLIDRRRAWLDASLPGSVPATRALLRFAAQPAAPSSCRRDVRGRRQADRQPDDRALRRLRLVRAPPAGRVLGPDARPGALAGRADRRRGRACLPRHARLAVDLARDACDGSGRLLRPVRRSGELGVRGGDGVAAAVLHPRRLDRVPASAIPTG